MKRKQYMLGIPGEAVTPEQAEAIKDKKKRLEDQEAARSWLADTRTVYTVVGLLIALFIGLPIYYWMQMPPPRGTISGTVTYNGNPLPGGRITFYPQGKIKTPASAKIDANGKYTIAGCITGPVKITIETFPPQKPAAPVKDAPADQGPKPSGTAAPLITNTIKLPAEYNNPDATPIPAFTVSAGQQSHDVPINVGG